MISFAQLPISPGDIELSGIIMGSIIVGLSKGAGIQFSLYPSGRDFGETYAVGLEAYVLVHYKWFDMSDVTKLMTAKQIESSVYVKGPYSPKREGNCLGRIEATCIEV